MERALKPVDQQVIVITGATSGIGLVTARRAAAVGARLVLAARNEEALRNLERELRARGAKVAAVQADVGRRDDVRRIAETALERFGGIDTWVNDAGVSIWGRLEDVSEEDSRRLFDTNFWGIVNGSLEAVRLLKQRGGTIINLGSLASDVAFPLQGMYCASKHAIKAFTESLRMELEKEGAPISVTLIKPAGIDTPFPEHAKNYLREQAALPPPVYPPEEVANAILFAASHPKRDIYVGGASKMLSATHQMAPRALDKVMEWTMFDAQKRDEPAGEREGALHHAGSALQEHGRSEKVLHRSLYTRLSLSPTMASAVLGAIGLAAGGLWSLSRSARG